MRPTIAEILAGINRTINTVALPLILNSGDKEAFVEVLAAGKLLSFVESRWQNEFARLIHENTVMQDILREGADLLRSADSAEVSDLTVALEPPRLDASALPSISTLYEQNVILKTTLEKFILVHASMPDGSARQFQSVRCKIREFLKEINRSDCEATQSLLTF